MGQFLRGFFFGLLILVFGLNVVGLVILFSYVGPNSETITAGKALVLGVPGDKPVDPAKPPPPPPPGPELVTLKLTVKLAPPFQGLLDKGGNMAIAGQVLRFRDGRTVIDTAAAFGKPDEGGDLKGPYPKSFSIGMPRDTLLGLTKGQAEALFVRVNLAFNIQPGRTVVNSPTLGYRGLHRFDPDQVKKTGVWDIGEIYLSHRHELGDNPSIFQPCKDPSGNYSGKVVPTQEFMAKAAGKKVVLAFAPFYTDLLLAQRAAAGASAQLMSLVYNVSEVQPAAAGIPFSFPVAKIKPSDYVWGWISLCDQGEGAEACAEKHYPGRYPVSTDGKGFTLAPEHLRFLHCSEASTANFIAHPFPPAPVGTVPKLGSERNKALPPEIVEGQML